MNTPLYPLHFKQWKWWPIQKLKNKSILKCILNYPTYNKSSFIQALGEQNLPYQLLIYEVFSTFYILSETQPHLWVDSNAQDV